MDQYRRPVPSPTGISKDYGVTFYLWDNKVVARLNWYSSTLAGASSNVSDLFNQTNTNIFNHFGFLNRNVFQVDANDDGRIDDSVRNAIEVDPRTGLTEDGLTRDQAVAADYPQLAKARAARANIAPFLTDDRIVSRRILHGATHSQPSEAKPLLLPISSAVRDLEDRLTTDPQPDCVMLPPRS